MTTAPIPNEAPARISRITVERLYNLGSYEHVRYGLTIDLPEGCDLKVSSAFVGVERILEALNPNKLKCCDSEDELNRKALRLQEDALLSNEEFHRRYGRDYAGTRAEYQERMRKGWEESKAKREQVVARAKNARLLLDDLGGASQWKDAKLDWEDQYNDDDKF
jgi:hypothetical protein